jgi:GNAT superfamily N-acetyltransferase
VQGVGDGPGRPAGPEDQHELVVQLDRRAVARPLGQVRLQRVDRRHDDETAQLRVLLVEPAARGIWLGRRLVDECVRFARGAGYRRIMLTTYDAMAEARRIYAKVGFHIERSTPVRAYGADVHDEVWSMDLN